ncbi:hypothetical protein L915_10522 [Phytophthora nicotianae]|uniref:Uncharacterized protein n=1 Tax=Phytophthora nicotianae TaxID=4792 RepID=W2IWM3_PHYNI|nr:hypothetical protein L915_10522 [Phytophthora nicotianae]ETL37942.1 hypothetical protein L916_10411 [Phytophthora nicotianae]
MVLPSSQFCDRLSIVAGVDAAQRLAVLRSRQAWSAFGSVAPLAQEANRRRAVGDTLAIERECNSRIRTLTRAFSFPCLLWLTNRHADTDTRTPT